MISGALAEWSVCAFGPQSIFEPLTRMIHSLVSTRCSFSLRTFRLGAVATLLAALSLPTAPLRAQGDPANLIVYDGFDYPVIAGFDLTVFRFLGTPNPGIGWEPGTSGLWKYRSNFDGKGVTGTLGSTVVAGSLSYGGLQTTGNHVHLSGESDTLELGRGFAETLVGTPGTSTYISFLAQRIGPQADPNSPAYDDPDTPQTETYPWGNNLYPRGASIRFFSKAPSDVNFDEDLSIGRFSNRSESVWSVYGSMEDQVTDVQFGGGELAFVVVRIDHVGDATVPDNLYMWVNPDLYAGENTGSADLAFSNLENDGNPIDFSNFQFVSPFAGGAEILPGPDEVMGTEDDLVVRPHAEMLFDELRIGRTWASVTPFDPIPEIRVQPADVSVPAGQPATLEVTAVGGGTLSYQWKRGDTNVGSNSPTFSIASAAAGDAGSYTVMITNAFGSVTSRTVNFVVTDGPVGASIVTNPVGAALVQGASVTLTVTAAGNTPLTYVWKKDGVAIPGAPNGPELTLENTTSADAGTYSVTVSNSVGSATSAGAELIVDFAPEIITQPVSVAGTPGSTVSLSVVAEALPAPEYQWYKDGVAIPDATGPTLEITGLSAADVGVYRADISNRPGGLLRLVTTDRVGVSLLSTISQTSHMDLTGTTDVPVDVPITLSFDETVQAGISGVARLYRADGTLIESFNLADTSHAREVGGEPYNYLPVLTTANIATLTFVTPLEYGETYYITLEPGIVLDVDGEAFGGITDPNAVRFSVRSTMPPSDARELWVNADGSADFATLQGAIDHFSSGEERRSIYVADGHYEGLVFLPNTTQNVRIYGESRTGVVITYPNNSELNENRQRPVFYVRGGGAELYSMTIMNTTPAEAMLPADALSVQAQSVKVVDVDISSYYNTVRVDGTAYFENCYIEGAVDMIWGEGAGYFQSSLLHSLLDGNVTNPQNTIDAGVYDPGFVFNECRLTAEAGVSSVLLGSVDEATYPGAEAVFLSCEMGGHIVPVGWALVGDPAGSTADLMLAEYQSKNLSGALLDVSGRLNPGSRQLTAGQLSDYAPPTFLGENYDLGGIYGSQVVAGSGMASLAFTATLGLPVEIRMSSDLANWTLLQNATGTGLVQEIDVTTQVNAGNTFFDVVDPIDEIVPAEAE
jgi:pectin methylesterase-like acyl-CoA thioesterase